jgi:hypothetical protein
MNASVSGALREATGHLKPPRSIHLSGSGLGGLASRQIIHLPLTGTDILIESFADGSILVNGELVKTLSRISHG